MTQAALAEYMATSGNDYAFLDVAFEEQADRPARLSPAQLHAHSLQRCRALTPCQPIGRLLFELYSSKLPKTCANFVKLCTGKKGGQSGPLRGAFAGWPKGAGLAQAQAASCR